MRLAGWRRSDTGQAAGLGMAVAIGNLVSLVFSVVFVRILGTSGFGALAALLSAFLILSIPGTALQATVAREVSTATAVGAVHDLAASIRGWVRAGVAGSVALALVCVLLRHPIASVLGVRETWAAAAVVPTAALWVLVSIQRGALQGFGEYRSVGASILSEAAGRLALGLLLVLAGAGTTGAFVGHGLALLAVAAALEPRVHRRTGGERPARHPLRELARLAGVPGLSLVLLAALQNLDVIVVKHRVASGAAGSYAAASIAAKSIVWVAVGLGLYLLPETSRRLAAGRPTRSLFATTLGLTAAVAGPMLLLFLVAGRPLLRIAFGHKVHPEASVLPLLGLAMTLLALTYLAVQYMLALRRSRFLWILGAAALLEPLVLVAAGHRLPDLAAALAALQGALAIPLIAFDLIGSRPRRTGLSFAASWRSTRESPPRRSRSGSSAAGTGDPTSSETSPRRSGRGSQQSPISGPSD